MNLLIFAMLFSGGMIPSYILIKELGLLNTIWALILPGAVPIFDVILLMNFLLEIPKSLEEAAIIDGAGPLRILTRIFLPISKPCLATISLFSIVGSWNDFYSGLIYIQKPRNYPIMTYIHSLSIDIQEMLKSGTNSSSLANITALSNRNLNAAKIVVAVIPLLFIYPLLQKYLISGIVMVLSRVVIEEKIWLIILAVVFIAGLGVYKMIENNKSNYDGLTVEIRNG